MKAIPMAAMTACAGVFFFLLWTREERDSVVGEMRKNTRGKKVHKPFSSERI